MRKLSPLLSCLALSVTSAVNAQPATYLEVEQDGADRKQAVLASSEMVAQLYADFFKRNQMPGLVYGVVFDGELVFSGQFGYADIEKGVPADAGSLFRIASMTKSITATAIFQLRDAGMLRLDDPVAMYLPELEQLSYPTQDAPPITIRQLLTHTGGLPEDNPWGDRQLAISDGELLKLVSEGLTFATVPGTAYEYSNLGYALLGQVIQRVSGMDFSAYTQEKILQPLGMKATTWEYADADETKLARGYKFADGEPVSIPLEHDGAFAPMAGLISSIEDFARFATFHLSAWPPGDEAESPVLSRRSIREMHEPMSFNRFFSSGDCPFFLFYAYGLNRVQQCDVSFLSHNGGLPGFGGSWLFVPEYDLAVISFSNVTYGSTFAINRAVMSTILDLSALSTYTPVPAPILLSRKQGLDTILFTWETAQQSGLFADNFFQDNELADLIEKSGELKASAGEILSVGELVPENRLRGKYVIDGSKADIEVYFTLTPDAEPKIQELQWELVE